MKKKFKIVIACILILLICATFLIINISNKKVEIMTVKSEKQLLKIYNNKYTSSISDFAEGVLYYTYMPFMLLSGNMSSYSSGIARESDAISITPDSVTTKDVPVYFAKNDTYDTSSNTSSNSTTKDYSKTNIQVQDVDEADITKTDGDYIYSISDDNVIITDVRNPKEIKIATTIKPDDSSIPVDLILCNNKLVVICEKIGDNSYVSDDDNTVVKIYDITNKEQPNVLKTYELYEPYYTCRCSNNVLYVISSGKLRKENDKIVRNYREDEVEQEIDLKNYKYLKNVRTNKQTLISSLNLDNIDSKVDINSYLIDISNAYVSKNSIYLLDEKYNSASYGPTLLDLYGWKGLFGLADRDNRYDTTDKTTEIYKFNIEDNGEVTYGNKAKVDGETINQYSLDEQNGHLRVALYDYDKGTKVVVLNENLKLIGSSKYVAPKEKMYSSRFIGDKAYLVTYKTIDPLWVIGLSDESNPEVLGELSIPGYSTYLHPYDENHLIGIGMDTKSSTYKDFNGRVRSTNERIVGMKMALFDVSNVNKPVQISQTIIGDSRTTSAILTNPKALLFSKEKNLIAIPVNNYATDFEVLDDGDEYESAIRSYLNNSNKRTSEGYLVYNINLTDGFKKKGMITHDDAKNQSNKYYYYTTTNLLRGLYIDNNLYTVSETQVKVNDLDTLDLVSELKIK